VVLLEGEAADRPLAVEEVQVGHVGGPGHAGHADEGGGGSEQDVAVGQVTGVVVVHIRLVDQREWVQSGAVGVQFEDLPAAVRSGHGEKQPVSVPVQVHVADETSPFRTEEGLQTGFRGMEP